MKKFWIGLAVGAVVGGVAALLLAPQSGNSTRRKVRRGLEDLGDSLNQAADYVKEQADRLSRETSKLVGVSKDQLDGVIDAASDYARTAGDYARSAGSKISDQAARMM